MKLISHGSLSFTLEKANTQEISVADSYTTFVTKDYSKKYVRYNNGKHTFTISIPFISTLQSQIILTVKLLLTNIFEIASSTNEIQYNPLVIEWYCYTLVHYVLKFAFVERTMLTVN